jgi:hypothetical protein
MVPVVAVGVAVLATLWLGAAMKHTATLFFCSIVFSSWFGGASAGIFATLLSAIALDYFFIPPIYALGIGLEEGPDMVAFVASALFVSWLSGKRGRAKDSLRETRDELNAKVRERTAELGKAKEFLQPEISGHEVGDKRLIQEHAEAVRVGCVKTIGELAEPVADELASGEKLGREMEGQVPVPDKMTDALLDDVPESLAHPRSFLPEQESVFCRQGDYWTIQYRGQIARLKTTRGLDCLATLLQHPGREFHVSQLIAASPEVAVAAGLDRCSTSKDDGSQMSTIRFQDAGPVLDARAKAEYTRRLAELREELEEAEQLNDSDRAGRLLQERDCIAYQLAATVGLGGRNRKAASQAERARSAVTKRIKDCINKISEAMPALGRHFAARIKTGYFCSYNPNPDRPVTWEVRS